MVLEESPTSSDVTELVVYRYLDNSMRWSFGSAKLRARLSDIEKDLSGLRAYQANQEGGAEVAAALGALLGGGRSDSVLRGEFATRLLAWLETTSQLRSRPSGRSRGTTASKPRWSSTVM